MLPVNRQVYVIWPRGLDYLFPTPSVSGNITAIFWQVFVQRSQVRGHFVTSVVFNLQIKFEPKKRMQ